MDEARAIKVQLPKGLESNGMVSNYNCYLELTACSVCSFCNNVASDCVHFQTSLNTYKDFSNGLKSPKVSNGNVPLNFGQYKPLIPPSESMSDLDALKNRHESGDSAYSSNSTNEVSWSISEAMFKLTFEVIGFSKSSSN